MTKEQLNLLSILYQGKENSYATACDGARRKIAHELRNLGYAEWMGTNWGSNFYAITTKGVEAFEETKRGL